MIQYEKIYLTHANLNVKLHLLLGTICGYYLSEKTASTHVYTPAGVFPAKEKPEEIDLLISKLAQKEQNKGESK